MVSALRKKILFVIDSLNCGGAEKSLVSLLNSLDYSKIEVDLMIITRSGIFEKYVPKEVNIISNAINPSCFFRILFSIALRISKLFKLNRHSAEIKYQCINRSIPKLNIKYYVAIAYQQGLPTYYVSSKVAADKKICWINCDLIKAGYNITFNTFFYKRFDKIITVSKELEEITSKKFPEIKNKITTIYDILNTQLIRKLSTADIGLNRTSELILTTVGRIVPQKGYDLAVDAAEILKNRGINFTWYFVGCGSEEFKIKQLIVERNLTQYINMVGLKDNPYPYMEACDIYVQPSKYEGFGLTIAEAKILKKPIVSTNFSVVKDQLINEKNGIIVEMNGESIANGIDLLYNDKNLRARIISNIDKEINSTASSEPKKVMNLILNK